MIEISRRNAISMRSLIFLMVFLFSLSVSAANTNTQKIARIQFDAKGGHLYFVGEGKWSSLGCENVTYIWGSPELDGRNEMLSIGLAAYMSGKNVTFWGECSTNTDYFEASYIIIREK